MAEGRIGFTTAALGCFAGIVAGDLLLFAVGRVAGRRALESWIIRGRISAGAFERSSAWIDRRGPIVVLLSRVTPGTRLPTCLLAGALRTDARRFVLWFVVAAGLWTPLVVGAFAAAGAGVSEVDTITRSGMGLRVLLTALLLAGAMRAAAMLGDWTKRRRLYGRWRRITRWEFWPPWVVYPPVLVYIAWLMVRYRGTTVFTAANPGIPGGGFVGESKFDILRGLSPAGELLARAAFLPAASSPERRVQAAQRFIAYADLTFPVVLKPDKGQRGSGVTIVRTREALESAIRESTIDLILQEFAPGAEFGIFYARHPASDHGHIISITEKRFPRVLGDGQRTIESLILADERAVCLERLHCRVHRRRLYEIPAAGDAVQLVEVGSHSRGALFLDAANLLTPATEDAFDRVAKGFPGFYFGRFDVRATSVEALRMGRGFKIVELNGVTSEAAHIYDPANSLVAAYRVLFAQWRLAFDIGAANIRRGAVPTPITTLLEMLGSTRGLRRNHRILAHIEDRVEYEYDYTGC